ncbi:MAG: type II toxin-antitoxin system HicA family toxin [Candidatus Omnitrophota bacterium]
MPKPIEQEKIILGLKKKGFREEEKKEHKQLRLYIDGKKTGFSTSISRGSAYKEYGMDLLRWMAKGLRLDTTRQLIDLIECPMSLSQYLDLLRQKNLTL